MLIIIVDVRYKNFKNTLAIHLFYVNEGVAKF